MNGWKAEIDLDGYDWVAKDTPIGSTYERELMLSEEQKYLKR